MEKNINCNSCWRFKNTRFRPEIFRGQCRAQLKMDRQGLTLIEVLVSISIIGVLIAMLFPAVQLVRESARRASCSNHIRQLAIAIHHHESANQYFPSGINAFDSRPEDFPSLSWLGQILPMVEQENLWELAKSEYAISPYPFSHSGLHQPVALYGCPSDPESGIAHFTHENRLVASTNYLGVNGTNRFQNDGVLFVDSKLRLAQINDGTSNTLLIGERPPSPDFWYGWWYTGSGFDTSGTPDMLLGVEEPNDLSGAHKTYLEDCGPGPFEFKPGTNAQCDTLHFWSYHPGGALFAFCDGSVKFISYDSAQSLQQMATRDGGELIVAIQ